MNRPLIALVALCLAILAGCAGTHGGDGAVRLYDFGIGAPDAKLAGVRMGQVRASAPFDSTDILYRLAYRNPAELLAFTQSRWAAVPAELLRKRFVRASESNTPSHCILELELHEVSQVFGSGDASEALLELRASLSGAGGRIAEHTVRVVQSGAGASAAEGVAAMVRAADRSIGELSLWVAQQPNCKGP